MPNMARLQLLAFISLGIASTLMPGTLLAAAGQCGSEDVSDRQKIGLVLGGGGARGYAHIGVLKKLEEMRVPYDYITGTSMGSIVGGFLAIGMESDELTRVVREADWDDLFNDNTEREDLPFRRKADDDVGLYGPKFGIGKDSSTLPKGVVSGQKIIFMFESVVSQRVLTSDFDQLPIPYRAIATDIKTGDMVILKDGKLSMAMRASMAVPAVFDPVHHGEALLVDGGLVRNLPVDIARDMGAEIVIAVDVGTKLHDEEEITDALAIVYQMSSLLTEQNTKIQVKDLRKDDVLITPKIGNSIGAADFDKLEQAIPLGYTAAEAMQDQLQKYSLSEDDYRAWRQRIENCVDGPPSIDFVHLDNQSRFSDDVLMEMITIKPGDTLNLKRLNRDLRQVYGLGFIRQARYHVVEQDGQQGIEIIVRQDDRGKQLVETGLDLSFSGRGTDVNFKAGYLNTGLDERGAEFRAMVQVGEVPGIFADFYKPLDDGLKYSFHPSLAYFHRPLLLFNENREALAEIELKEIGAALAFGRDFGRFARLTAGFTRYLGDMEVTIGDPELEPFSFDGAELFVEFKYDRLDDRYLPRKGLLSELKYTKSSENLGADVSFDQLEFSFFGSHTIGLHSFILGGQYNTSLDDDAPIYGWYTGGGFLNMSGFEPNSLVGPHFGQLMTGYRYQVGKTGLLPAYAGMTLEYGNAAMERSDIFSDGLLNGSVYLGYPSPLGPVYLGVGWSEEHDTVYYLRMGSIFGPRSLGRR